MVLCKKLLLPGFILFSFHFAEVQAQADSIRNVCPVRFAASYIGDAVYNVSGGIKRGGTYLGLANLKFAFDTEKAHWWKGGTVFVNAGNTHGGRPSEQLVGDFLGVSNIEAGNHTFMYELWYRQELASVSLTAGLQDLNADFAVSENGTLFNNSTFGIQSSISDNVPVPIFPLTALGLNVSWKINEKLSWSTALFDGVPDDFQGNAYNLHWKINKRQGSTLVSEWGWNKSLLKHKNGMYKLGCYFHQHLDSMNAKQQNGGAYVIVDQQLTSCLSAFSQLGLSLRGIREHNHYYSLGLNCKDFSRKRQKDQFGMAVAYAEVDGNVVGSEIALEWVYEFKINDNLFLKPDIQYIIHPAGTDARLPNALVGLLRWGFRL